MISMTRIIKKNQLHILSKGSRILNIHFMFHINTYNLVNKF